MGAAKAYIANLIFTGDEWLNHHAVIVEDGIIKKVLSKTDIPAGIETKNFGESIIAPAFIDLQIYGAYEKLFAVYPDTNSLHLLNKYSNSGGAAFCMPTVATNKTEVFYKCIDAIRIYWQQGGKGILGLHAEGPWINKEKRGAHIESLIHRPSLQEVEALLNYGKDVIRIITLAPEVCSREVIDLIRSSGVKIFAGHSNAAYGESIESFDNGIDAVTHLYNAMSPLQHRSPGLVGATFDHPAIKASIIADGYHVDYAAIRIAKKIMGERLFAITDAVTTSTEGYYQHQPDGDKYTADNILSGSALTMYKAFQNLVKHVGIETGEAIRMCSLYPAQIMGFDDKLGMIGRGYRSNMVLLPELLNSADELRLIS
ncbi:MAG: N-acetylglucosamine-6-phosphate deacetylase [Ferruginibacter sp.]|nr:N-acetylglucosamine-6-phosphate deacetylase [Ferruginibacter sp.]